MSFSNDYQEVFHRLSAADEMKHILESGLDFPSPSAHDVTPYLSEIRARSSFMSPERLYKLAGVLSSFEEIRKFFRDSNFSDKGLSFPHLMKDTEALESFPGILSLIYSTVNKFGEVKDSASPELMDIRTKIRQAQGSVQRAMRRVLDAAISKGVLDKDAAPSVRDGRLVIPVSATKKRELIGIVHDESATGKTVFIEPAEVVEAGNRIRELELEEKHEVMVILMKVADEIRPFIDRIASSCHILGHIDFVEAKARFAIDTNGLLPKIEQEPEIEWYHAIHPGLFLSLREQGREVVPLTINLSEKERILIISGPNAGGKSVTLKTVAVVQYMLQCGMLPTLYENSHCGIFKNILIDIGDEQSFENDLSTYSSHLRNMKAFIRNAGPRTLFLADEMGSGTEPQIGGAIAQAILMNLGASGAMGIVTTHYHNLKTFAESTPGFINGAMLYDRQRLEPTFQLSVGSPGSSFAIDIAHKMGLPQEVIENAKEIVGGDYVNIDKYLSDIARDRRYWASKRQNIKEKENKLDRMLSKYEEVAGDLKSQRKEILIDAKKEAAEILKQANAKIERTILEIRNAQAEKERTKELRKKLQEFAETNEATEISERTALDKKLEPLRRQKKNKKNPPVSTVPAVEEKKEIRKGDFVLLDDGKSVGEVLSIDGKKAEVAFGALRTIVEVSRLKSTKKPKESALKQAASISASTSEMSRQRQLNFRNEIDVRGMRADEAIQAVTYFLDDAIQFGSERVRILHGTGHGILKTLIRQQLKANPAVSHFEDEDIRFGGAGITVVDLL